ncbi:MAG: hypothetical protein IJJ09_03675 [Synergistaceae bacterium]|nr:hypothetical protein [Synergistaceae bacterium]
MADNMNANPQKTFSELWRETIYTAHVNFLRKRDLYEDWKKFKAGKKLKQDDFRLMSEFIKIAEQNQSKQQ